MSLKAITPGTYSLLVDGGRPRTRALGVPIGGPADRTSFVLGNALAGNAPLAPALEITLSGPTLLALADVGLCVFGAPLQIERDGEAIPANHTFTLSKGQTLRIGGTSEGCRGYVCVAGGFRSKSVLGSMTSFEPMKAGDMLVCAPSRLPGRSLDLQNFSLQLSDRNERAKDQAPRLPIGTKELRCLPGPQADWFNESFFRHSYIVTPNSNRMGIRLEGPTIEIPKRELVSEPVAPGAIQITNDGTPIVLGVDGQTIGGYPKLAHVISADLDWLGQLRPGDEVRFQIVSENDAEAAADEKREAIRKWLRRIAVAIGSI